jgi:hypothetical protein
MLKSLITEGVGPAPRFDMEPADRLSVIVGDNGLGKSFLLDAAWWACTRDWPENPALPSRLLSVQPSNDGPEPLIATVVQGATKDARAEFRYDPKKAAWVRNGKARPPLTGLVLYARVDGGFSVFDPARHYFRSLASKGIDDPDRPPAFHLTMTDVWRGKRDDAENTISRGLLVDWREWQLGEPEVFAALTEVLRLLSTERELLAPADRAVQLPGPSVDRIPALRRGARLIPITLASAAVKRIVALAYLIVWTWWAHKAAAQANGLKEEKRLFILIDEIEAHLHPQWQRVILPAVMKAAATLYGQALDVQLLVSTHSPMVMASLETEFDPAKDKLFHLGWAGEHADLRVLPWSRRGDAEAWLTSEVFGLTEARSVQAEKAIAAAEALYRRAGGDAPDDQEVAVVERDLAACLSGHDPYWGTWFMFVKRRQNRTAAP